MNHKCSLCGETFSSRNKLFIHVKTHENPAPVTIAIAPEVSANDLKIVYENEDCRIVSKPQGLPTMGLKGANLLKHSILLIDERMKPGIGYKKAVPCHRLDSATGGLVLCSKSRYSETIFKNYFREKLILKKYLTLVPGVLHFREGFLLSIIDGKNAISYYQVVSESKSRTYGTLSTIYMWPITGKKHQLRKQMKELGHPMIGDPRYSQASQWPSLVEFNRLFLWAIELVFPRIIQTPDDTPSPTISENMEVENQDQDEDDEEDETEHNVEGNRSLLSLTKEIISAVREKGSNDIQKIHLIPTSQPIEQIFLEYLASCGFMSSDINRITISEPSYYEAFRQYESV